MKKKGALFWIVLIVTIAINIFIIVNACINGEASAEESNTVAHTTADVINAVKPETITEANFSRFAFSLRKILGHFSLFALSGIMSTLSILMLTKNSRLDNIFYQFTNTLSHGIVLAIISEYLQTLTDGRSGNVKDIWIDFAGYILGVVLMLLVITIIEFVKTHKFIHKKNQGI